MKRRLVNALAHYNHQARLYFLTVVAMGFTIDGVYAILLNLYLLRLGYGTEFIGLVNAVGLLTFAVVSLPAGILGARWSNTLMIKIGIGMAFLGGGLLPFAEFSPMGWQESWLIVSYAMMLCGFSLFFVNGAPFLMNIVNHDQHNDAFAIQTAVLSLAAFFGSLIGGMLPEFLAYIQDFTLDDPVPYRTTLLVVSVVMGIAFAFILTLKEPAGDPISPTPLDTDTSANPLTELSSVTTSVIMLIGVMSLVRLLQVAGMATAQVYFNVYMDTELMVSTGTIGTVAAIGRLLGVPTALLVPILVRRWGNGNVVIWGSLATAFCLIPLALIPHWIAAAIGFIGMLALTSIRFTAFVVYILELVPKVQQSVMAGSGEMAAGFSFAGMALGGGIVLAVFTFRDLFLIGSLLTTIGTMIFWWHFRTTKAKAKRQVKLKVS